MSALRVSLMTAAMIAASTSFAFATGNHGAPLPIIGAGLPLLAAGGALYALRKRFRKGD